MKFFAFTIVFLGAQAAILFSAAYFYKRKKFFLCCVAVYFPVLAFLVVWRIGGGEDFLGLALMQFAFSFSYTVHLCGKEKS
ncbi:hypothetical protein [Variovorax sp. W6]|uniref:hypothetical protein n=1 Tax=Variovorax sp. W6 TaxID=3093895 RepID=UPI003D8070F9